MPLLDMVVLTLIIAALPRHDKPRQVSTRRLPVGHGPNQRSRIGVRAPDGGQDDLGYPHSEGHQTI
jgi:hypothetical protein